MLIINNLIQIALQQSSVPLRFPHQTSEPQSVSSYSGQDKEQGYESGPKDIKNIEIYMGKKVIFS